MFAFFPHISRHADDKVIVDRYTTKMIKYVMVFILPIILIEMTVPGRLITLLFPSEYVVAADALRIISSGMLMLLVGIILSRVFQAIGRPFIPAMVFGIAVLAQLLLLAMMVPTYGIEGAAGATAIVSLLGMVALLAIYSRGYRIRLRVKEVIKLVMASGVLVTWLLLLPLSGKAGVIIGIILGFLVYVSVLALTRFFVTEDIVMIVSAKGTVSNRYVRKFVNILQFLNDFLRKK